MKYKGTLIVQKKQTEQSTFLFLFLILCPFSSQEKLVKTKHTFLLVG